MPFVGFSTSGPPGPFIWRADSEHVLSEINVCVLWHAEPKFNSSPFRRPGALQRAGFFQGTTSQGAQVQFSPEV